VCRDVRLPKSYAWQVVRSYYSAFYSAHALLRLFGFSCSHLPKTHLDKVYEVASLLGRQASVSSIESGYFYAVFDSQIGAVRFQKVSDSHADTWSSFLKLIAFINGNLSQTTSLSLHRLTTSQFFSTLESCLTHKGCNRGNWLSAVRNDVNYKFGHSAWFPYRYRETAVDLAERRAKRWADGALALEYNATTAPLTLFFETCFSMVALCRAVFMIMVQRSEQPQSYITTGAQKLLNQLNVSTKV
jgi:hypothetical protein